MTALLAFLRGPRLAVRVPVQGPSLLLWWAAFVFVAAFLGSNVLVEAFGPGVTR